VNNKRQSGGGFVIHSEVRGALAFLALRSSLPDSGSRLSKIMVVESLGRFHWAHAPVYRCTSTFGSWLEVMAAALKHKHTTCQVWTAFNRKRWRAESWTAVDEEAGRSGGQGQEEEAGGQEGEGKGSTTEGEKARARGAAAAAAAAAAAVAATVLRRLLLLFSCW
jgi:hypothetical protein